MDEEQRGEGAGQRSPSWDQSQGCVSLRKSVKLRFDSGKTIYESTSCKETLSWLIVLHIQTDITLPLVLILLPAPVPSHPRCFPILYFHHLNLPSHSVPRHRPLPALRSKPQAHNATHTSSKIPEWLGAVKPTRGPAAPHTT